MNRFRLLLVFIALCLLASIAWAAQGCGVTETGTDGTSDASDDSNEPSFPDGSGRVDGGDDNPLQCVAPGKCQVACPEGKKTTVTGHVYDPAGKNPLYNVVVYVPKTQPDAFTAGVSCDRCGAVTGSPIASTLTDPSGYFELPDVPVGDEIPIVLQVGKWRKQGIVVPHVDACVPTEFTEIGPGTARKLRLPANQAEGDMPQMAIATGSPDPLECLLRRMGVDEAEFTVPPNHAAAGAYNGRVHYYVGDDDNDAGEDHHGRGLSGVSAPNGSELWSTVETLEQHDIVFLPCNSFPFNRPNSDRMVAYTTAGGRIFATHFSYPWLTNAGDLGKADPFPGIATWRANGSGSGVVKGEYSGTINTGFAKGLAFSQWLANVSALTDAGKLDITVGANHVTNLLDGGGAQTWITGTPIGGQGGGDAVEHMTFNTPLNAPLDDAGEPLQCGRVVFSDFHVTDPGEADGGPQADTNSAFPGACAIRDLTPDEKALEFMIFDLSSCVQKDTKPPVAPPPIIK